MSRQTTVVRNVPWFGISVAAHMIAISILSVIYVTKDKEDPLVTITSIRDRELIDPEPIEPPLEMIRSAIPDIPDEPVVEEDPTVAPIFDVTERVESAAESESPEDGVSFGFEGSTSIGVGIGGHRGTAVSPYAGPKGPGGGPKGKYGPRFRPPRTPVTPVIHGALEWLAHHQDPRGFWSPAGFSSHCQGSRCSGEGSELHTVGLTGLALLAFLGAGNTLDAGPHQEVVSAAVKYLLEIQDPASGAFGEANSSQGFMYDQALASLAMCEAFGLSGNRTLKKSAQKAVYYVQSARNPYKAWRYSIPSNGDNDTSVTGWMVMVLQSAKDFGLAVDEQAFAGAKLFLDEMTDPSTGRCGYVQRGSLGSREPGLDDRWPAGKVEPMTAVSLVCRIFMGADTSSSPELRKGADLLRKSLPLWDVAEGTIDYYYWYYGSYAMFQMGGQDWDAWEKKMLDAIIETQADADCERGSWDPAFDPWGHQGGRVYSTAIMALCAEVYCRYDRVIGARK